MCSPFLGLIGNYSAASAAGFSPKGCAASTVTEFTEYIQMKMNFSDSAEPKKTAKPLKSQDCL